MTNPRPTPEELAYLLARFDATGTVNADDAALLVAEVRALQQELRTAVDVGELIVIEPDGYRFVAEINPPTSVADTPGFPFGAGC